jgi:antitoxin MazE
VNVKIIKIGNSQGILIPKSFMHQAKLDKEVQIDLTEDGILIKPKGSMKRKNWGEKFRKETRKKQPLLLSNFGNDFDKSEWEWK